MEMKIEFHENVIEQNFDIKGVKVKVIKIGSDQFHIIIEDNGRFDDTLVPREYYNMLIYNCNLISHECNEHRDRYWCKGLSKYSDLHYTPCCGYIQKDFVFNLECINIIIEAVVNGVNKLEELENKQEEIKVGDYVKPKDYVSDYKHKVIAIYNNEIWVESIGRYSSTGIYKKSSFVKDNAKL